MAAPAQDLDSAPEGSDPTGSGHVAVLGAGGTMGFPMAGNLAEAGLDVRAWNRSPEKIEPLAERGIGVARTPRDAAHEASAVITILSGTEATLESMTGEEGALAAMDPGGYWVQMGTIGIEGTERCAVAAAEAGVGLVDAPVLGTKAPAEAGELTVLASGPEEARDRVEAIFDAVGKRTLWLGETGTGSRMKLVTNTWILAIVEGLAETLALAEGLALEPERFLEAIEGGPLDLGYAKLKGKAMIERDFEPSFKLELAAKDARLVEEAVERHGLDLPLVSLVRERLEQGAREHGEEDMAATFRTASESKG